MMIQMILELALGENPEIHFEEKRNKHLFI